MTRAITTAGLNRATLERQGLLRREPMTVVEAVHRAVAIQAQAPESPYVALWNRVADFDPADLDRAFADHSVIKATLVRITLHAVDAGDYPAFHQAMVSTLRAARLHDRRFKDTGLSIEDLDALLPDVLAFTGEPRANAEMEAWLAERVGAPVPRAWWAMRSFAPVVHAAADGPWTHGSRPRYVTARAAPLTGDPAESVRSLLRRYLEGFGPATAHDFAQFTMLRMPIVRAALDGLAGDLVTLEGPDGTVLHDTPGAPLPDDDTAAPPRLLAMWDNTLLAYADRSRIIPPEYRTVVIRRNGDVLPTLLVDGLVAGVWRPVDGGIEATAFHDLPADTWEQLEAEARSLTTFLTGRDPRAYARYARWWDSLPSAQVRLLRG